MKRNGTITLFVVLIVISIIGVVIWRLNSKKENFVQWPPRGMPPFPLRPLADNRYLEREHQPFENTALFTGTPKDRPNLLYPMVHSNFSLMRYKYPVHASLNDNFTGYHDFDDGKKKSGCMCNQ